MIQLFMSYLIFFQRQINISIYNHKFRIENKNINTWKIVDITKKLLNYNFEKNLQEIFETTHYTEITIYTNPNEIPYLKSLTIASNYSEQQQQIQGQNNYQIAHQIDNVLEQNQTVKIVFSILDGNSNKGVFKQDCKLTTTLLQAAQSIYSFLSILKETASFAFILDNQELGEKQQQLTFLELGIKKETNIVVKLRWIGGQLNYIDLLALY